MKYSQIVTELQLLRIELRTVRTPDRLDQKKMDAISFRLVQIVDALEKLHDYTPQ